MYSSPIFTYEYDVFEPGTAAQSASNKPPYTSLETIAYK